MLAVFIIANIVIVAGYLFLATRVAPFIKIEYWWTKAGGVGFFFLCALTHAGMAWMAYTAIAAHTHVSLLWTLIHVAQAIAVWTFVLGLYKELVLENRPVGPAER